MDKLRTLGCESPSQTRDRCSDLTKTRLCSVEDCLGQSPAGITREVNKNAKDRPDSSCRNDPHDRGTRMFCGLATSRKHYHPYLQQSHGGEPCTFSSVKGLPEVIRREGILITIAITGVGHHK